MMKLQLKLFLIYSLMSCVSANAQNNEGIEYIFGESINRKIDDCLRSLKKRDQTITYYMTLNRIELPEETFYQLLISSIDDSSLQSLKGLINRSARFYSFDGHRVPIILDYDFAFVGYGKDTKGRTVRKNVTGREYFTIEFDKNGDLLSSDN